MGKLLKGAALLLGAAAAAEAGGDGLFLQKDHEEVQRKGGADHEDVRCGLGKPFSHHA